MTALCRASVSLVLTVLLGHGSVIAQPILGFDRSRIPGQHALEGSFDSLLSSENLRVWLRQLSAHPHHIGTQYGKRNAEFIAAQFRSWGYATALEEFHVLFPTPKIRVLEMLGPEPYTAVLAEQPLAEDATSGLTAEQLPLFNAYSVDGDVTGQLVYANYGVPKDYEELERRGIDVRGKIVITRYGGSWRGIKPKVAAEHGAIGCIIYSDPHEDGYYEGDVYPKGAYRNTMGGQRGSVADMPVYSGDPLTPGVGATKDAKRLALKDAQTLTKIPVLPISYGDALPLLRALQGPVVRESWRGALPITYHYGPGPATVHLKLAFSWDIVPIYDVIARLEGSEAADEWVIRGNHHDAWVFGAQDPLSGLVSLMEEARAIGMLRSQGWKPKRTIVYCAWDGEEQGLLGSTEWVETHADELAAKAAVYLNSDGNGRGFLSANGSHSLERFVNQVARDVRDPQARVPVAERLRAINTLNASATERKAIRERSDFRIGALGSGSDYTPFLQHLGVASLHIGYGGEDGGGSYHSIYDSFDHYTRFGDPGFAYGVTQAQTAGRLVLRCANADFLPFDFDAVTETVARYVDEVVKLADDMREETEEVNRAIRDRTYDLAADPTEPWITPAAKDAVPFLNFAPLQNALANLRRRSAEFREARKGPDSSAGLMNRESRRNLDRLFMGFERSLTTKRGLPGRPWYVHAIYAPGRYTGYGVKTLPGVREAIEHRAWKEAQDQIVVAAEALDEAAHTISQATRLLR